MAILTGNSFNNSINGTKEADTIDALEGNDAITGGKGNDTMFGGIGNDLFFWNEGDGSDDIFGGAGIDTVSVAGSSIASERFFISFSNDLFLTRTDTAAIPSVNNITLRMSSIEKIFVAGVEGNDQFVIGNLTGSNLQELSFSGGAGNDFIDARTSNVKIIGEGDSGNDIILGGSAFDSLTGGTGNDTLSGGGGNDTLLGVGTGSSSPGRGEIDALIGGAGADTFILGDRRGVNNAARVYYDDGDNTFDGGNNIFTGMDGVSDFARIFDFTPGQDRISLVGRASDYVLRPVSGSLGGGNAAGDTGIFKARSFIFFPDELIAVVNDVNNSLNLNNSSQFNFV